MNGSLGCNIWFVYSARLPRHRRGISKDMRFDIIEDLAQSNLAVTHSVHRNPKPLNLAKAPFLFKSSDSKHSFAGPTFGFFRRCVEELELI